MPQDPVSALAALLVDGGKDSADGLTDGRADGQIPCAIVYTHKRTTADEVAAALCARGMKRKAGPQYCSTVQGRRFRGLGFKGS
jgi:hypothetical protein